MKRFVPTSSSNIPTERVPDAAQLRHPIFRESFALLGAWMDTGLELPPWPIFRPGTGLGSSGSFTTALLKALHAHNKNLVILPNSLRRRVKSNWDDSRSPSANRINTSPLTAGSPVFKFLPDGKVEAWPLKLSA